MKQKQHMQPPVTSQFENQGQSAKNANVVDMQFNPPKGKLKPMTDTETSSSGEDEDLSSGSPLSGTETSGIDTSSMSQSLQSSAGVKGLLAAATVNANGNSMPKQTNHQFPQMAYNQPNNYAGTMQHQA